LGEALVDEGFAAVAVLFGFFAVGGFEDVEVGVYVQVLGGRALDNVFCERLWRSVKYENIYLNQYDTVRQLQTGLTAYFDFYNHERPHQSLNYRTPAEEHFVL